MTNKGVWLRGGLYVVIAGIGFLQTDQAFRATVAPLALTIIGLTGVVFTTIRAYIDQSPAQEQRESEGKTPTGTAENPLKTEITNTADDAIPVTAAPEPDVKPIDEEPSI